MANWTTPEELVDAWIGDDEPLDLDKVEIWIGKAERLIRFHIPDLAARVADDTTGELLEDVKDVVTAMVQRVFRNPEGIRQRQETTGPFTGSVTFGGDVPGGLALTDDEMLRLSGGGTSTQRAFGISQLPATSLFSPFYTYPEAP